MSREQQVAPQDQQLDGPAQAAPEHDTHGLPPEIYQQVMQLPPGIPERLAQVLNMYPGMSKQICDAASSHVGMSTVKQALEIQHSGEGAGISRENQAEIRAMVGEDTYKAPTAGPAAAHKAEPAWVVDANRYNDAHPGLVAEFNDLTNDVLALDDTKIDPKLVARWQRDHGIAADGKIGPHTVATARATRHNATDVAKAPAPAAKPEQIDT